MDDAEILAIAARVWEASQGEDFTMERLSEATGVSRATLYRRFGSRDAILQRLAEEHAIDIAELGQPDIPTRIMHALAATLNRSGFAGVTVEKVAQEAGVGPATVYRHFGSKDALIETFIRANSPRQMLRSLVAHPGSDLEADLVMLAHAMLEFMAANRGLIRTFAFENDGSEEYLARIRASQGRTVYMLADYLAGHMALGNLPQDDAFDLALAFVGILLGIGLVGPQSYNREIPDARAAARMATRIFLHGVIRTNSQSLAQPLAQAQEAQR